MHCVHESLSHSNAGCMCRSTTRSLIICVWICLLLTSQSASSEHISSYHIVHKCAEYECLMLCSITYILRKTSRRCTETFTHAGMIFVCCALGQHEIRMCASSAFAFVCCWMQLHFCRVPADDCMRIARVACGSRLDFGVNRKTYAACQLSPAYVLCQRKVVIESVCVVFMCVFVGNALSITCTFHCRVQQQQDTVNLKQSIYHSCWCGVFGIVE